MFSIYCGDLMIGTSDLGGVDAGMGVAVGAFFPTEDYEKVRKHFRLFTEATFEKAPPDEEMLGRFYARNSRFRFAVIAPDGTTVPLFTCLVRDYSVELPDLGLEAYQVEVQLSEQSAWFHGRA
ncbi:MAG: hypothetical protein LWW96_11475 [Acidovorax sp.]|uniref:hypothetical protein n=1 Tax=Acidovorax sp. TaxID=1872122 RepID=UPI0025BBDAFA|nr:hypothetical protein [Acidovorax sp.]MCE1192761.1 hypothetical protein [Acidovorax sp.]